MWGNRIGVIMLAVVTVAAALWLGTSRSVTAGVVVGVVGALATAGFARWALRRQPHTSWADASAAVGAGHAVVFWKPTCSYCERLLRALRADDRITWVNVWADRDANAEVRRHNDGDELTPTALVGDAVLINPSADELRRALG